MTKKIDKTLYTEDSIQSLSPLEFTRHSPGVYCGDTTYSTQLLVEILSNSIDEYRLSHGSRIEITLHNQDGKHGVTVQDWGQGFPTNSYREDGKTILEAAFSVLNTSGKYDESGVYSGTSLGSFGIGSKLATFLSHSLCVITKSNTGYEAVLFEEGVFSKRMSENPDPNDSTETGTIVNWWPSEEFFDHTEVEINKVKSLLETIVALCPGLTISLEEESGKITEYNSKNGLNDLVDKAVKNNELIDNRFNLKYENGKNKIDMVLTYTSAYGSTLIPYVNTGLTESGPHITQVKTIITREFNKFFKEKKWLKEKDENLTGDDIQEGMYIIFNITTSGVSYNAQVKSNIVKIDMSPFTRAIIDNLEIWMNSNEKEVKLIADKAINARKAREAAKKARDNARNLGAKKTKSKLLDLPTKLVEANSKDRSKCELLIAEGDSAASGLVEARDPEIHAIFPIRGKLISAYKNSNEKIFANQEVINIIKALGLDLDQKRGKLIYDKSKLRYRKILLCADGDPDGEAIRNLLIEFFWWVCPELILNGHVYSTFPPLFRITTNKNRYIFLKDAAALAEYNEKHKGEKYLINRNKGLGEQDSHELREALIDPETRNIKQLVVEDKESTAWLIECLLGPSVPPRREYLLKHSEEARGENE